MCLLSYVRNYTCLIFLVLGFVVISESSLPDGVTCFQTGSCSCTGANGEVLDLLPLSTLSQPLIAATSTKLYIYHPCVDAPLKTVKNNTCQKSYGLCYFHPYKSLDKPIDFEKVINNQTSGVFENIASNKEAVIRINALRQIEIVYKNSENGVVTTTMIKLECNHHIKDYKLSIDKTAEPDEHVLTLSSQYACVKAQHYLSGGAIFVIITVVLFLVYFVGGILVLKFIRGATGLEMIPNHEFWCKLCSFAKEKIMYVVSCGKTTPDSYEQI